MKTHHILGILWLALCGAVIISVLGWLRHLLSASEFRLTPDLLLAGSMFIAYLTGAIASLFLLRGKDWARIAVGIVAVLTVIACTAQFITMGRLSAFAGVLGICAFASLVLLLFAPGHVPSTTGSPRFPTFTRLFRWFFSRRTLGRILITLAALATIIAVVCAEENWRGKRAWLNYKHQMEGQGEKLDWQAYVPPPVPDAQNFTTTPFLAPLLDFNPSPRQPGQSLWRDTNGYNRISSLQEAMGTVEQATSTRDQPRTVLRLIDLAGWAAGLNGTTNQTSAAVAPSPARAEAAAEVLRGLAKYDPIVEELRGASQRPRARFNIQYDHEFAPSILLPHLAFLKSADMLFQVRASAELALGRADQAWADTRMALYLADAVKDEPFLISRLVQVALDQIALQPIWEGLAEHRWSDAQLMEIEQRLGQINLLADAAMRGERAMGLLTVEQLRDHDMLNPEDSSVRFPRLASLLLGGFFYQNELCLARMYQQFVVPVADSANQRIYPSRAVANDAAMANAVGDGFRPYRLVSRMMLPAITDAETKFAFGQTRVNQAIVACALERYRLAEGRFPETLELLSPRFLPTIPHDVITGAPFKYRRMTDSQFILYSVGWNEKDDGGTIVLPGGKDHKRDLIEGDWVWQYPTPAVPSAQTAAN